MMHLRFLSYINFFYFNRVKMHRFILLFLAFYYSCYFKFIHKEKWFGICIFAR